MGDVLAVAVVGKGSTAVAANAGAMTTAPSNAVLIAAVSLLEADLALIVFKSIPSGYWRLALSDPAAEQVGTGRWRDIP